MGEGFKVVAESIPGIRKPLTKVEAGEFYHSFVAPLRRELGVDENQTLEQYLIASREFSKSGDEEESGESSSSQASRVGMDAE